MLLIVPTLCGTFVDSVPVVLTVTVVVQPDQRQSDGVLWPGLSLLDHQNNRCLLLLLRQSIILQAYFSNVYITLTLPYYNTATPLRTHTYVSAGLCRLEAPVRLINISVTERENSCNINKAINTIVTHSISAPICWTFLRLLVMFFKPSDSFSGGNYLYC